MLAKEKITNQKLRATNYLLHKRSLELGKLKLAPYITPRTMLIVNSANFSDLFGTVDSRLLDVDVQTFELKSPVQSVNLISVNKLSQFWKGTFQNGESVCIKASKGCLKLTKEKTAALLSYEFRILSLVGKHPNIIEPIGLSSTSDFGPMLLSVYVSEINLSRFLAQLNANNGRRIECLIIKLSSGLQYLHDNDILHNYFTSDNIFLTSSSLYLNPVIGEFSCACFASSANPLTLSQREIFKDCTHLPAGVKSGLTAPSLTSDLFSFGVLCSVISRKTSNEDVCRKLRTLVKSCVNMNFVFNLNSIVYKTFDD